MTQHSDKSDDVTSANEQAKEPFTKGMPKPRKDAGEDVAEINKNANKQFDAEPDDVQLGNRVGGLRGSSD